MTARLIDFPKNAQRVVSDPDLAELAKSGDRTAFTELVRRHQKLVRGMMRRLTNGHSADADDISQAAFLRAWTQIGSYSGGQFKSWMCSVAYREFLQAHRKDKAAQRIVEASTAEIVTVSEYPRAGIKHDIQRALASLSEEQRIAVVLCVSAGLTHAEASQATGWPLGTVKSHVSRGKLALQKSLVDYDVVQKER